MKDWHQRALELSLIGFGPAQVLHTLEKESKGGEVPNYNTIKTYLRRKKTTVKNVEKEKHIAIQNQEPIIHKTN